MDKKHSKKTIKTKQILIRLVDLFLETGSPIGSATLQGHGFEQLSPATLRNYFSNLEEDGFLKKYHASGGRAPTDKALRFYLDDYLESSSFLNGEIEEDVHTNEWGKNILQGMQESAERLSSMIKLPTFLSHPRFEHDMISSIKLLPLDENRILSVISTEFGQVFTEVIFTDKKLSSFGAKRIEQFISDRLSRKDTNINLSEDETNLAEKIHRETVVRYLIRYTNFNNEDIYKTGFSTLLNYQDFQDDPAALSISLSIFENQQSMNALLEHAQNNEHICSFVGEELSTFLKIPNANCSAIVLPYMVNKIPIGAIGIIGPRTMNYKHVCKTLMTYSNSITNSVTKTLYKFKLSFKTPYKSRNKSDKKDLMLVDYSSIKLLSSKENE